jgi:hypothetical protein
MILDSPLNMVTVDRLLQILTDIKVKANRAIHAWKKNPESRKARCHGV